MLSHVVYTFRPYLSHLAFIAFIAFMRESALRSWVFFGVQQSFTLLEVEFKQNMDQMNEMMESRGLPTELRVPWLIVFFMANPWGGAKLRLFSVEDQQNNHFDQLMKHAETTVDSHGFEPREALFC